MRFLSFGKSDTSKSGSIMPRFVILEHDHPVLHWDLMLEAGAALQTWRLAAPPAIGVAIAATALADHRRDYLDYEGPVSGKRGTVRRWDAGDFIEDADSTPTFRRWTLAGMHIQGRVWLEQVDGAVWRFQWTK
jgi:hypothetical protein